MVLTAKKQWFLAVFIGLAVAMLFFAGAKFNAQPAAQAEFMPGPEGKIMIVPIQIERDIYGIAMVDTASQNIWIYQLSNRGPVCNRLKLLAARSWKYDKLLEQYNTAEPKPEQVKALLNNLGQQFIEQPEEKQVETNEASVKENEPNSSN